MTGKLTTVTWPRHSVVCGLWHLSPRKAWDLLSVHNSSYIMQKKIRGQDARGRGHYRMRPRPRPAIVRPRPRPRPHNLASRPGWPRGLNIPGFQLYRYSFICCKICLVNCRLLTDIKSLNIVGIYQVRLPVFEIENLRLFDLRFAHHCVVYTTLRTRLEVKGVLEKGVCAWLYIEFCI